MTKLREPSPALQLGLLKGWYFFFFGSQYTQAFIPVILQTLVGLSPSAIGAVMCARRVVILLGAPLFTFLCDWSRSARLVIPLALACYYSCSLSIALFERSVILVVTTLLVRDLFLCGVEPSVNAAVLAHLAHLRQSAPGKNTLFADVRLFGSIGWGALSFFVPFLTAPFFDTKPQRNAAILATQAVLGVLVVALTAFSIDFSHVQSAATADRLSSAMSSSSSSTTTAACASAGEDQALLSAERGALPNTDSDTDAAATQTGRQQYWEMGFCASAAFGIGALVGAHQVTYFLYLGDLGLSEAFMGSTMMVACAVEAVALHMIRQWRASVMPGLGVSGKARDIFDLVVSLGVMMVMMALYISLNTLRYSKTMLTIAAYAAAMTNGVGYALFVNAVVSLAAETAPVQWKMSAQGAVQSIAYGAGPSAGALAGGWAMDRYGVPTTYGAVIVMLVGIVVAFNRVMRFDGRAGVV